MHCAAVRLICQDSISYFVFLYPHCGTMLYMCGVGVIFYFSPHFSRMNRVLSLATNITIMFFVQALTYNIAETDDGTCESFTDAIRCVKEESALAKGESKCYWDSSRQECRFSEPTNDFKRVVFVAVICAVVCAPLALSVDWLIISVLAKHPDHTEELHSRLAEVDKTTSVRSRSSLRLESLGNRPQKTFMRQQSLMCRSLFNNSATDEMDDLSEKIRVHRQLLTAAEKREFDGMLKPLHFLYFL